MKRYSRLEFAGLSLLLIILVDPMSTGFASKVSHSVSAESTVTASGIVVPAHVTELGFLIPGPAKAVLVKEGDEIRARQTLVVLDTPELEFKAVAAGQALRAAQAEVEIQSYKKIEVRRHGRIYLELAPPEVRQIAAARAQQADVALEIAQINLAQGTLLAPHDGTVTSINAIPGEFVRENETIITLATLENMQIETTDLGERDITKIHIGDSANIFLEALNTNIHGKVTGISPIADVLGGDVVFKVTIALDEQPKGLLWGMTAEVNITDE